MVGGVGLIHITLFLSFDLMIGTRTALVASDGPMEQFFYERVQ